MSNKIVDVVINKTINEWLTLGIEKLDQREYNNPSLEVKLLMEAVLDCDRVYLLMHGNDELSDDLAEVFMKYVSIRATGKPIQYILGHQEFMGLDFELNDFVLVPRGDTEILVEYILNCVDDKNKKLKILDIGTGSGAIALSLAHFLPNSKVWTVDINPKALEIARINSIKLEVSDRVVCVNSDVFEGLEEDKFDIIVSNPPYIRSSVIDSLQEEVKKYEPRLALDGGDDGLIFYRRITSESVKWLIPGGLLAYEIGHDQGSAVAELMDNDFEVIEIKQDYGNKDRVVAGKLRLTSMPDCDSVIN